MMTTHLTSNFLG